MNTTDDPLEQLKVANLNLRHQLETAEALLPSIHEQVLKLAQLGLTGDIIILGNIFYGHEYPPMSGRCESGQLYQSALLIPGGIGAVSWDTEVYLSQRQSPEGLEGDAIVRFVPLENCSSGIRALLVQEVHYLLEELARRVLPKFKQ